MEPSGHFTPHFVPASSCLPGSDEPDLLWNDCWQIRDAKKATSNPFEDSTVVREDLPLLEDTYRPEYLASPNLAAKPMLRVDGNGIPPGARWTKLDPRLVIPEALESYSEPFEECQDFIVVLVFLTHKTSKNLHIAPVRFKVRLLKLQILIHG